MRMPDDRNSREKWESRRELTPVRPFSVVPFASQLVSMFVVVVHHFFLSPAIEIVGDHPEAGDNWKSELFLNSSGYERISASVIDFNQN